MQRPTRLFPMLWQNDCDMAPKSIKTAYVVGAGFSSYAGLPLTAGFTDAILAAREFGGGPSKLIVDYASRFIRETFNHSTKAKADKWPDLEDIFTCVDLAANSGHHLGSSFRPSDLRTVRRAILSRIIRMLDQGYEKGRRKKGDDWFTLDNFFSTLKPDEVGFISMNWDNVVERKLQIRLGEPLIDYNCDALPAAIPDLPNEDDYPSSARYIRALKKYDGAVHSAKELSDGDKKKCVPLIKIHGSINWLYCDNCRRLFWCHPDQVSRIADQMITPEDLDRMERILGKSAVKKQTTISKLRKTPPVLCFCADGVALGSRIATFSYRKALEFPMFQKSWFAAEELLRNAEEWVFIGYSLPAADFEFKYLLKRTQLSRKRPPLIKVVSGGSKKSTLTTLRNYRRFFGRDISSSRFYPKGLRSFVG